VSEIEDENLLDADTAEVPSYNAETPDTFGRNLLRRLGIPHGHVEAEAASTLPSSVNINIKAYIVFASIWLISDTAGLSRLIV